MKNRSSLVSRFAASTAVLAVSVVILAIVFFVVLHGDFFEQALKTTLRGFSSSLAELIWEDPEPDRIVCQRIARAHGVGMVVETPNDRFAFGPDGEPIDPEQQLNVGNRYRRSDITGPGGQRIAFFWDMVVFRRAHAPLLIALVVLLLVMIAATYTFQVAHLRPLEWLRTGVEAVSQGDFNTRVPVVRQDEIGQVAQAFNQMTRRIEQMISDRERLLGNVSHELGSPLARIKVALELLPESDKRDAIARDVRVMEALTTALLEREQVRARTDRLEMDLVDLVPVTRGVVNSFEGRPPGVGFVEPTERVEVRADAALMGVLVQNLVDNAVKFSLADSRPVEVSLRSTEKVVELVVHDDGRGIPEGEAERVFEPFVKLDPARGHRVGYGLGLNLCRRIVEAHGGLIEISAVGERGTQVLVRLPPG